MLLSPDDPGATGGSTPPDGGVSDDNGAADQPQYVTAEQFEGLKTGLSSQLKEATDGLFSMTRKLMTDRVSTAAPPKSEPTEPPKSEPTEDATALREEMSTFRKEQAFDREVSRLNLDPKERGLITKLHAADMPDDPAAWLQEQVKAGYISPTPAPGHPAPTGAKPKGEVSNDLLEWSKEDREAHFQRNAPNPSDRYSLENRPYYQKMKRQMLARMKDVRIDLGPPRP